ncbi:Zn(2)-C6 fungal-type DNA-binding domain protein [Cordyceps fumosorosea ARSEF 2679]|uniref:Zn(2)-C6 fungal-type DNA-binding domain protein n=1 Tax=Cordyceps fumosorosea (strain ARSEF 2679) TaxID=1081104 RepID=A0A162MHE6_CORFA|nr:Zn(2)-C6 fungal-type DNA-binding domain protein [Cordyceps fumosorosea ARSEF 2679]OAA56100.1 Zn(2)-C6 fungal-type DNA-binding domain protein [Cordyceps fumosorosea ARSEF 2679]
MPRRARGPAPEEDMKVAKPSSSSAAASSSSHPPKRQRVSLACDACRMARERCDGARPQCGTCTAVGRGCSYTPALRKRGIKTGYLRAVELSLAWLLARAPADEEALHRLFVDDGGGVADQLFVAKGKTSDRLYKKWVGSRIYGDIDRILSEDRPARADMTTTDDDDHSEVSPGSTEHGPGSVGGGMASTSSPFAKPEARLSQVTTLTQIPTAQRITYPKLPPSWRRLVDIYFTYTHCWLPIVQQEEIYFAAMLYTADGLQITSSSDPYATACHAQLWVVLAMASFQDVHTRREDSSVGRGTSPQQLYEFAKGLIPNDDANLERPMACTMLLHALILMGRGNGIAAWLMVGRAARLILLTESDLGGGSGVDRGALAKCPPPPIALLQTNSSR